MNNSTPAQTNDTHPFEMQLRRILYRFDCPPSQALGEYHLGLLSDPERTAIEKHLALCSHCRGELATLDQFLRDLDAASEREAWPESGVMHAARTVIARLVEWGQGLAGGLAAPGLAPAPVGVRGEAGGLPCHYVAEDMSISLSVEPDPAAADKRLILGLVIPPEGELAAWEGTPVVLEQAGETIGATQVDDLSNFALSGVAPGVYDIVLQGDRIIRLEAVEVT